MTILAMPEAADAKGGAAISPPVTATERRGCATAATSAATDAVSAMERPTTGSAAVEAVGAVADLRTYVAIAAKPMMMRSGVELNSEKVGELPLQCHLHVVDSKVMADGSHRCNVAPALGLGVDPSTLPDCNRCRFCLDKKRNGGTGTLRRRCQEPC